MTTHALPDEFLVDYAAGILPEAFSLVVAAQASLCDETRARIRDMEQIGGVVLDTSPGVAMADGALASVLSRIRSAPAEVAPAAPVLQDAPCAVLPKPVRDYVGGGLSAIKWRPLGMGAKQAILHDGREASARLISIPPGSEMPDHGHQGLEMTLVLKGAFFDGEARFERGDVEVADESTEHHPVADTGEECICLAACAGSLKFSGLLPRIAQPFLRI